MKSGQSRLSWLAMAATIVLLGFPVGTNAATSKRPERDTDLAMRVLSNRADLVSDSAKVAERDFPPAKHYYIPVRDGTTLSGTLYRPTVEGRHPVVLVYGPYGTGEPTTIGSLYEGLRAAGYNVLTVSIRGTGCSGGEFEPLAPQQGLDGYDVIEWAARQRWSDGKVGMTGHSYKGMVQWITAATRPPHLRAITPFHFHGDAYRDFGYPGGIFNYYLPLVWTATEQPVSSLGIYPFGGNKLGGAAARIADGDTECRENRATQNTWNYNHSILAGMALAPYDGPYWRALSMLPLARRVEVPAQIGHAWQDEWIASRGLAMWWKYQGEKRLLVTNGGHFTAEKVFVDQTKRWLDRWLRGIRNGVDSRSESVRISFETAAAGGDQYADSKPLFSRDYSAWPPKRLDYQNFFLREDGKLEHRAPSRPEPPDSYTYPASRRDFLSHSWPYTSESGVTYETEPFSRDSLINGPWTLRLYADSTTRDLDFFASLALVSPSGDVTYLSRGLLRASHRDLDEQASSQNWPVHRHSTSTPLEPGRVYAFDLETQPVATPVRVGWKLRLEVFAPPVISHLEAAYQAILYPGEVSIHHEPGRESVLRVPIERGSIKLPPPRECGELVNQPCKSG